MENCSVCDSHEVVMFDVEQHRCIECLSCGHVEHTRPDDGMAAVLSEM